MGALALAFLKNNWLPIAIGVAVLAIAGGLYLKGRSDGAAVAEAEKTKAVFDQLKERNATDEKVRNMSPAELCRALGGQLRNDRCE